MSVVLLCTAADADRVNAEVATLIGDPKDARNLSIELLPAHAGGHGRFDAKTVEQLASIKGLTVSALEDGCCARTHWACALKYAGLTAPEVKSEE